HHLFERGEPPAAVLGGPRRGQVAVLVQGRAPFSVELDDLVMTQGPYAGPSCGQVLAEEGPDLLAVGLGGRGITRIHPATVPLCRPSQRGGARRRSGRGDAHKGRPYWTAMDVLVVVGGIQVPERIASRTRRRVDIQGPPVSSGTISDLRAHIPRSVRVIGPESA